MADFTVIPDASVDPDAPITSELAYAWRDNPIAIAQGAAGAPRISDAALSSTATADGAAWVSDRIAIAPQGGRGSFGLMIKTGPAAGYGATVPGSSLTPSSADAASSGGGPMTGTWMCMGFCNPAAGGNSAITLFKRVA